MNSWLNISADSDFSIYNLPFGIFSTAKDSPRIGIAIGKYAIDLSKLNDAGLLLNDKLTNDILVNNYLNDFIALGKEVTVPVRERVQGLLCDEGHKSAVEQCLISLSDVTMHMPVQVGDYTDFYSSIEHATNVGMMFRDPENALLPNWKHIPVGYHGRSSSIVPSGTEIHRPKGQVLPKGEDKPVFSPCRLLDFELEMAFIVGKSTKMGSSVSTDEAANHIFGMTLFNDWSARDIQKWEYVPLGPFLGKSFASTTSAWVVTLEALAPFKVDGPQQDPPVQPYLAYNGQHNYDINLEVAICPEGGSDNVVSKSNYQYMYWNMAQQLAHHTVNGCNINVGDMMASGTISGKDESSYGSMLEISWAGSKSLTLNDGSERKFIKDGDTVKLKGYCEKDGMRVGFGEANGKILPAN